MEPDSDIVDLILQVMQGAMKENQDELRDILAAMQHRLDEKKRLSDLAQEVLDAARDSEINEAHARHARVAVQLPKGLAKHVRDKVESGLYLDSSEAIRDALREQIRCAEKRVDAVHLTRRGVALLGLAGDSKRELTEGVEAISDALASLGDLDETEQMRLQMVMDRLSKAMEMLSNILKKLSDTESCIAKNIK